MTVTESAESTLCSTRERLQREIQTVLARCPLIASADATAIDLDFVEHLAMCLYTMAAYLDAETLLDHSRTRGGMIPPVANPLSADDPRVQTIARPAAAPFANLIRFAHAIGEKYPIAYLDAETLLDHSRT
jgi:hypothetical protein